MVAIPVFVTGALIWFPTVSSILLSFTNWDGIGGLHTIHWIGTTNYRQIATIYPAFWPAFRHNFYWLFALAFVGTPFGMFLAYQLDKNIRGTRLYQSVFYIPVVIAPAIIGLITELVLSPQQGLISSLFADPRHGHVIDWLGNPSINLWAVLVFACWRHASYVMILYLAGLKALDPTLREAAAIDGASEVTGVLPGRAAGAEADQHRARRDHGDRGAARLRHRLHHQSRAERPRAPLRPDHRQHHRRGEPHRLRLGDRGRAAHDLDRPDRDLRLEQLPGGRSA